MSWSYFGLAASVAILYTHVALKGGVDTRALLDLLWLLAPIVVTFILGMFAERGVAWGWNIGVAALYVATYVSIFVWPTGSTAPIALLFIPLWGLLLIGPIGAGIGHAWQVLRE